MLLARTTSVADTRALAGALAGVLAPGDLLVLSGEMGAGKTAFTQGLGAALGFTGRITSPTFTIVQTYEGGRIRIHHLDVYRLEHLHEALDVGLSEMLDDDAVVVVEWGDAIVAVLPEDHLELSISFDALDTDTDTDTDSGPGRREDTRIWAVRPCGDRWRTRTEEIRTALDPWAVPT